jgi:hypothetical protein
MQIRLDSGRVIDLCELRQYYTYEGLIEGLPTAEGNRRRISSLMTKHTDESTGIPPYVLTPAEEPVEWDEDRPYPFGTPSAMPSVTCIGRFQSLDPARVFEPRDHLVSGRIRSPDRSRGHLEDSNYRLGRMRLGQVRVRPDARVPIQD